MLFWSIWLHNMSRRLAIDEIRFARLLDELEQWENKFTTYHKDLQRPVGLLHFAMTYIYPLHLFLVELPTNCYK